jgi:hypothetical protein
MALTSTVHPAVLDQTVSTETEGESFFQDRVREIKGERENR